MGDARDEVDDVLAAWGRERPDLDTSPMEVLSRVDRLARHVDRARAAAFSRHDLEGWEFDVLAALRRSGEPYRASPGALVRSTGVTSGTMTNRVDRLAARGLLQRKLGDDELLVRELCMRVVDVGLKVGEAIAVPATTLSRRSSSR